LNSFQLFLFNVTENATPTDTTAAKKKKKKKKKKSGASATGEGNTLQNLFSSFKLQQHQSQNQMQNQMSNQVAYSLMLTKCVYLDEEFSVTAKQTHPPSLSLISSQTTTTQ
jgi:hypothetical protein